ncbi:hypothetical protein NUSPORA_02031 [Nucleospora cyclopteri]
MEYNKNVLFLFDVDGTLSESRCKAPEKIIKMLKELRKRVKIAFVGGSDLSKQIEQMGDDLLSIFDYGFPENGVQFYKKENLISEESFIKYLGEENYKKMVNKLLTLLSEADCPKKRGNFIECRRSMINVSPVGRSCTREERLEFFEFNKKSKVREIIVEKMEPICKELKIVCSIGGQISIDVFPVGWDKTYCLQHIKEETVIFFGDMVHKGGNDHEIYTHPRTKGIKVEGPESTIKKVNEELKKLGIKEIE